MENFTPLFIIAFFGVVFIVMKGNFAKFKETKKDTDFGNVRQFGDMSKEKNQRFPSAEKTKDEASAAQQTTNENTPRRENTRDRRETGKKSFKTAMIITGVMCVFFIARDCAEDSQARKTLSQMSAEDIEAARLAAARSVGSFTDPRDGQTYRTVRIGDLVWMAQNLNTQTNNSSCSGDDDSNCDKYGRLYTWQAAMSACPDGWRLPRERDWYDMFNAVGGRRVAGTRLKSQSGWFNTEGNPENTGTDEFGFAALPGGCGGCGAWNANLIGTTGYWWTATAYDDTRHSFSDSRRRQAKYVSIGFFSPGASVSSSIPTERYSVRCVAGAPVAADTADVFTPDDEEQASESETADADTEQTDGVEQTLEQEHTTQTAKQEFVGSWLYEFDPYSGIPIIYDFYEDGRLFMEHFMPGVVGIYEGTWDVSNGRAVMRMGKFGGEAGYDTTVFYFNDGFLIQEVIGGFATLNRINSAARRAIEVEKANAARERME